MTTAAGRVPGGRLDHPRTPCLRRKATLGAKAQEDERLPGTPRPRTIPFS